MFIGLGEQPVQKILVLHTVSLQNRYGIYINSSHFNVVCMVWQNARQAKDLLDILREAGQSINPKLYDMMEFAKTMIKEKCKCLLMLCCLFVKIFIHVLVARMRYQARHGGQSGGIGSSAGSKPMNGHSGRGRGGKFPRGRGSSPWSTATNGPNAANGGTANGYSGMYTGAGYGSYSQQPPALNMYPPPPPPPRGLEQNAAQFSMPLMYYPVPPHAPIQQPPVPPTTSSQ